MHSVATTDVSSAPVPILPSTQVVSSHLRPDDSAVSSSASSNVTLTVSRLLVVKVVSESYSVTVWEFRVIYT